MVARSGVLAARRLLRLLAPVNQARVHFSEEYMATGIVKWFNDAKGYGFITPDDGSEDLFAHFSEIQSNGFRSLQENQKVTYDVKSSPKGKQAANISTTG